MILDLFLLLITTLLLCWYSYIWKTEGSTKAAFFCGMMFICVILNFGRLLVVLL